MKKRAVRLGDTVLGEGRCAVCVPVMGETFEQLGLAAAEGAAAGADVLELRADSMCAMPDTGKALAMCQSVRAAAPNLPLIFTLRTARDGGAGDGDCAAYEALLAELLGAAGDGFDALDVELSVGDAAFSRIAALAHEAGVAVIGSSHDFGGTPEEEEICARLCAMQRLGADVCKIAVTPRDRLDVLTLMRAAVRSDEALLSPVIAIAMGELGALTRIGAEAFGSCLTFGAALGASAPGQIDARKLKAALEILRGAL